MYDSASAHLSKATKDEFLTHSTCIVVIPGDLTLVLQSIDIHFIFVFRNNLKSVAHNWEDAN